MINIFSVPSPTCQRGSCGFNAECYEDGREIKCRCLDGYEGNPRVNCIPTPENPCEPNPCGANTQCRVSNNNAVCACLPLFFGNPNDRDGCKPECLTNTDCPTQKACFNTQCKDPCIGSCGVNAVCKVVSHRPVCSCPVDYMGNPYTECVIQPIPDSEATIDRPPLPCQPSPCGSGTQCHTQGQQAVCLCLPGYIGEPYTGCRRPECTVSSDCSSDQLCLNHKCIDPCPGSCGVNSECSVVSHNPICRCRDGYTGDPFTLCYIKLPVTPCHPNPCGINAQCSPIGTFGLCTCLPGYNGDPKTQCEPECVTSSDCLSTQACIRKKCRDPCPGACGSGAQCIVVSHNAICSCPTGYFGNPDYGCQPECVIDADCLSNLACFSGKCIDPCPGLCGSNAECYVSNHRPICNCKPSYTGDPYTQPPVDQSTDPCRPSPCGPNSKCEVHTSRPKGSYADCRCLPGYFGNPFEECKPECTVNSHCPFYLACVKEKCIDPCRSACGLNADCQVVVHAPVCTCRNGYTGDPYDACSLVPC
ncbi:UNVERIFIED_CONTAM: hypothetical protein GTU68_046077 [Idotea baltica]|nr:hypothetical protein [Idotea baltica]